MKRFSAIKVFISAILVLFTLITFALDYVSVANAMPFYDLKPEDLVLRAEFSTDYGKSSEERKHNIRLAAKSLNDTLIDVNGEFSFNRRVGARTEKRGYKTAKIIVNGEFTEGVGGGVCQVSTTLYNAALLAGLKITEAHAHSLAVSYVKPSFDAMVNAGSADLRFINKTHNPVVINTFADGKTLTVRIYGEPMREKYERKSVVKKEIEPEYSVIKDSAREYPDLFSGERKVIKNGKKGIVSEGYLVKKVNGKVVSQTLIRRDRYSKTDGVIVEGTTPRAEENPIISDALKSAIVPVAYFLF
ncbi:MAG: VanW family protein [Clostridia bacterium]|nr:VanW family protein [Clostridia bacterium]